MDVEDTGSVTIVERTYPPNRSITGESACDLARFLVEHYGIEVHIVHVEGTYDGGSNAIEPVGRTHTVKSLYNGKQKIRRFIASLLEGRALIKRAIALNKGPIICMTNPPLLNFWAGQLIPKSRPWFLWSMDLYPDAFISSKLVGKVNPFYKYFRKKTYKNPPTKLIALGPLQAEYIQAQYNTQIDSIILPCGITLMQETPRDVAANLPSWKNDNTGKIVFGYCGNIGEAHSPQFLKHCIDAVDPDKHHFVLVAYGVHASDILAYANGKPGLTILDSVPREQLQYIDINIVSLKKDWVHVCVPSKLVSAVYMGSNFLFCGIAECDNWHMMQDSGWLVPDDDNMEVAVKTFFETISLDKLKTSKETAKLRANKLVERSRKAYNEIALAVIENQ